MANKLIHVATIFPPKKGKTTLFLRKLGDHDYRWYSEDDHGNEIATEIGAETTEEALQLGRRQWRLQSFKTLGCGFRYTLPERDEHGMNALFHQMTASLSSMNGVYFDEELGHNCFVQNASDEAIKLWHSLKPQNRL